MIRMLPVMISRTGSKRKYTLRIFGKTIVMFHYIKKNKKVLRHGFPFSTTFLIFFWPFFIDIRLLDQGRCFRLSFDLFRRFQILFDFWDNQKWRENQHEDI